MAADPGTTPFVTEALWAPNPASGSDGRRHLVYELRIGNTTGCGLEPKKVEVLDEPSGKVLLSLDRDALPSASRSAADAARATELGVGQFGVLFLHVALEPSDALPRAIAHRISLRLAQPGIDFSATVPYAGRRSSSGGAGTSAHRHGLRCRRRLLRFDSSCARPVGAERTFTLAQRFAIDWEQADAESRVVKGTPRSCRTT